MNGAERLFRVHHRARQHDDCGTDGESPLSRQMKPLPVMLRLSICAEVRLDLEFDSDGSSRRMTQRSGS